MQALEIITVNLWHILLSLGNLAILFFVLKHFLYKPVRKVMQERQAKLDGQYERASLAESEANAHKALYEAKLSDADAEAALLLRNAADSAERQKADIIAEGKDTAARLLRQAEEDISLERKKAEADMKKELVELSAELSKKLLAREMDEEDHHRLIDGFLTEIEGDNE